MKQQKVKVGQLWQDWDIRLRKNLDPRIVRIVKIETKNLVAARAHFYPLVLVENIKTKKRTRIRLDRFKPNSTGWLLLK